MTIRKKAGTPKKGSKKLNLKKKTLKDLEPRSGKDAKGGFCSIRPPSTSACQTFGCPRTQQVGCVPVPPKTG